MEIIIIGIIIFILLQFANAAASRAKKSGGAVKLETLGSAPARPANATASVPAGRTTGGTPAPARATGKTLGGSEGEDDAKAAAARAAEERMNRTHGSSTAAGAKLQGQLDAQKKQTMNETRKQDAANTQAARDADAAAQARQWN